MLSCSKLGLTKVYDMQQLMSHPLKVGKAHKSDDGVICPQMLAYHLQVQGEKDQLGRVQSHSKASNA